MQLVGEEGGPEVGQKVDREVLADQAAWEVQAAQGGPVHLTSAVIYVVELATGSMRPTQTMNTSPTLTLMCGTQAADGWWSYASEFAGSCATWL